LPSSPNPHLSALCLPPTPLSLPGALVSLCPHYPHNPPFQCDPMDGTSTVPGGGKGGDNDPMHVSPESTPVTDPTSARTLAARRPSPSSPTSRSSHQRQHNKDKPYKCPNCYRAYTDSASLQIHLSAHAIKHAKAYCCSMCGRAYTSVSMGDAPKPAPSSLPPAPSPQHRSPLCPPTGDLSDEAHVQTHVSTRHSGRSRLAFLYGSPSSKREGDKTSPSIRRRKKRRRKRRKRRRRRRRRRT
ncbi:zinc finger protein 362, partial [Lamprotornis superbus]